jgi:succinoglycan biosynthesis protein ExoA
MSEPTVSVVIPSYNEEHYIDKTLENLIDQYDNDHYEIIVVDGRSTDRTRQKIEAFAGGASRGSSQRCR